MLRLPTDSELSRINRLAKKKCAAEDVYVIDDVAAANDFNMTLYCYYIGTSSLFQMVQDVSNKIVPLSINHEHDIPLGVWLSGEVVSAENIPQDARAGKNYLLKTVLYMPKGLSLNGYNTDELVKAYQTGTLSDVSVGMDWRQAKFICNICGNNLFSKDCDHWPGATYDGVLATFTVENAGLNEISFAWKGALPGATLKDEQEQAWRELSSMDWSTLKEQGKAKETLLSDKFKSLRYLTYSSSTGGEEVKTFKEIQELYANDIAQIYVLKADVEQAYVLKADHDGVVAELTTTKESLTTVQGELTEAQGKLTEAETKLSEMTDKYGEVVADLDKSKELTAAGQERLDKTAAEYQRLSVARYGDKYDHESDEKYLATMPVPERLKFMEGKIETLTSDLELLHKKGEHQEEEHDLGYIRKSDNPHTANPELYKVPK